LNLANRHIALSTLLPCIKASFPGSPFGIVYNTTSQLIPTTFETSPTSKDYLTTISDSTTPDLGACFRTSGANGYLNNACNGIGLAYLAPPQPPVEGLKYVLPWSPNPASSSPEGSIFDGFKLGPAPSYETVINDKVNKIVLFIRVFTLCSFL
jgi:hypothetical protein